MWKDLCPRCIWRGLSQSPCCCVAYLPGTHVHPVQRSGEVFPRRRTSFAQLPLIAQGAWGGAQQFANELRGPGLSTVEQNTTNSAEDSLQVSRAPLLD